MTQEKIDEAIKHLEWCCDHYAKFDEWPPIYDEKSLSYELMAGVRQALRALKEEKDE